MAKQPGTAVANLQEQLKKEAAELRGRIAAPTGNMIKLTKAKTLKLPDGSESPGPLNVVILDFVSRNLFYKTKFNEKNPVPPDCFAIGTELRDMRPSDNSPDKQSEECASCPQNQFPEGGGGKPCKNTRLLAVMQPNAKGLEAPILLLQVSPTSLKSFDGFVNSVDTLHNTVPIGVVAEVTFDPNSEYQSLRFGNPRPNPNVVYHMSRREEARKILRAEPDTSKATAKAPAGKGAQQRGRTYR